MTPGEAWPPLLVELVEELVGKPLDRVTWRDLLPVQARVDALLTGEVNRLQAPGGAT